MQELFRIFLYSVPTRLAQEAMKGSIISKVSAREVIVAQITQVELDRGEGDRRKVHSGKDVFHVPIISHLRAIARTI